MLSSVSLLLIVLFMLLVYGVFVCVDGGVVVDVVFFVDCVCGVGGVNVGDVSRVFVFVLLMLF